MEPTPAEIHFARACYFAALRSFCVLAPLTPSVALRSADVCIVRGIYELARGLEALAAAGRTVTRA